MLPHLLRDHLHGALAAVNAKLCRRAELAAEAGAAAAARQQLVAALVARQALAGCAAGQQAGTLHSSSIGELSATPLDRSTLTASF